MSNARILYSWDRSDDKFLLKSRGKVDVELWCIPDGFIGLQLQEQFKHTDLFLCVSYLTVMYFQLEYDQQMSGEEQEYHNTRNTLLAAFITGVVVLSLDLVFSLVYSWIGLINDYLSRKSINTD